MAQITKPNLIVHVGALNHIIFPKKIQVQGHDMWQGPAGPVREATLLFFILKVIILTLYFSLSQELKFFLPAEWYMLLVIQLLWFEVGHKNRQLPKLNFPISTMKINSAVMLLHMTIYIDSLIAEKIVFHLNQYLHINLSESSSFHMRFCHFDGL